MRGSLALAFVLASGIPATSRAQAAPRSEYLSLPVELRLSSPPGPVVGPDGHHYVSYLALLTNWGAVPMKLVELSVTDPGTANPLVRWDSTDLAGPGRIRGLGS
jgi:hypothetical protein